MRRQEVTTMYSYVLNVNKIYLFDNENHLQKRISFSFYSVLFPFIFLCLCENHLPRNYFCYGIFRKSCYDFFVDQIVFKSLTLRIAKIFGVME